MPFQNEHEIHQLYELAKEMERAAHDAKNNANLEEIKQIQGQLRELQNKIQDARGKAISQSGTSTQPLIDAQLRVENTQHAMQRAINNLEALDDEVQP